MASLNLICWDPEWGSIWLLHYLLNDLFGFRNSPLTMVSYVTICIYEIIILISNFNYHLWAFKRTSWDLRAASLTYLGWNILLKFNDYMKIVPNVSHRIWLIYLLSSSLYWKLVIKLVFNQVIIIIRNRSLPIIFVKRNRVLNSLKGTSKRDCWLLNGLENTYLGYCTNVRSFFNFNFVTTGC